MSSAATFFWTSFRGSDAITTPDYQKLSVARWQPKGYNFSSLRFFAAVDVSGGALLLRNYADPLVGYATAWAEAWAARETAIRVWLDSAKGGYVLCCWCPYSRPSQAGLAEHGTFACHTLLIHRELIRLGHDSHLDADRREQGVRAWLAPLQPPAFR